MCLTCDVKVVQELARLQGRFKYLPSFLLRATIRGGVFSREGFILCESPSSFFSISRSKNNSISIEIIFKKKSEIFDRVVSCHQNVFFIFSLYSFFFIIINVAWNRLNERTYLVLKNSRLYILDYRLLVYSFDSYLFSV